MRQPRIKQAIKHSELRTRKLYESVAGSKSQRFESGQTHARDLNINMCPMLASQVVKTREAYYSRNGAQNRASPSETYQWALRIEHGQCTMSDEHQAYVLVCSRPPQAQSRMYSTRQPNPPTSHPGMIFHNSAGSKNFLQLRTLVDGLQVS